MERCEATRHRFAKFDDATTFCERCGEQRVMDVQALIAKLPPITYLPCPLPHYPQPNWYPTWWQPTSTWPTITVWSDTGTSGTSTYGVPDTTTVLT